MPPPPPPPPSPGRSSHPSLSTTRARWRDEILEMRDSFIKGEKRCQRARETPPTRSVALITRIIVTPRTRTARVFLLLPLPHLPLPPPSRRLLSARSSAALAPSLPGSFFLSFFLLLRGSRARSCRAATTVTMNGQSVRARTFRTSDSLRPHCVSAELGDSGMYGS